MPHLLAPALLGIMSLSACSGHALLSADGCDWTQPIRPSVADQLTTATARQILVHNETGAVICGWQP